MKKRNKRLITIVLLIAIASAFALPTFASSTSQQESKPYLNNTYVCVCFSQFNPATMDFVYASTNIGWNTDYTTRPVAKYITCSTLVWVDYENGGFDRRGSGFAPLVYAESEADRANTSVNCPLNYSSSDISIIIVEHANKIDDASDVIHQRYYAAAGINF